MKIWSKIHLRDRNKNVELISKSLTNYLYGFGPILDITRKYNIPDTIMEEVFPEIEGYIEK